MSSFEENYDTIVGNNKNELLGLLNQMHALGPAFQAFHQICKQHKIKPLRKRKGQYNANKRNLSAYNIFTQEVQNNNKLKDKNFQERSKLIGAMWKKVKADDTEHQKYKDMADDRKKVDAEEEEVVNADEVPDDDDQPVNPVKPSNVTKPVKAAKQVKEKPVGKEKKADVPKKVAAVKRGRKKEVEVEKVVDPSEVSEDEVYVEDSDDDDDVFDSDDEVSE